MAALTLDGVPATALGRRWGVPRCDLFARIGSALDAVHDLGARGAPHGAIVIAEVQTAGRGRDGRTWRSPAGGAWLAALLRPAGATPGVVSVRAGLVIADAVDELVGRPFARLKWPNDVLLDGRKLAGILCEGRWQGDELQWLAVGIGVNVCNGVPEETHAIALRDVVPGVRRLDLLDRVVPALPRLTAHGGRLTEGEAAAFATRDWLSGREIRSPARGRARGLAPDGALLVDAPDGTVAVREGHVELA